MTKDPTTSVVEQNNDTKPAVNENDANQPADTGNVNPDSVPYARFNELSKQNKKLQKQMDEINSEREEARIKRMEEEGKTKELYSELQIKNKALEEKNAYYEGLEEQERESLLSQIPDGERSIYEDLSTLKLRAHVENIAKLQNVKTDKSAPLRGNNLGIKHDSEIWKMDPKDRKKNWGNVIKHFKKS